MKKLFILIAFISFAFISNAQLKDLTGGGVKNTVNTSFYYNDAVSNPGTPFSMHVYQRRTNGTNTDTVTFQLQVSNTTIGNGAWENLGSGLVCKPADTSLFVRDTLWFRRIRVKATTSATSNKSYHYAVINYQK